MDTIAILEKQLSSDIENSSSDIFNPKAIKESGYTIMSTSDIHLQPQSNVSNDELFPPLPKASGKTKETFSPAWAARIAASKGSSNPSTTTAHNFGSSNSCGGKTDASAIPRKFTERFDVPLEIQAKQKEPQLGSKTSVTDVCKQVMKKTNTSIEVATTANTGTLSFLVTGQQSDEVALAKRQILNAICIHVTQTVTVPASVRPIIVGTGGKNLKALTNKTMTRINLSKRKEEEDENEETSVTISGDCDGVEIARKEIESIVASKTSRKTVRLNIERSYHPFISGPGGAKLQQLQSETNTRIILAPLTGSHAEGQRSLNEIVIIGDKENADAAQRVIEDLYEDLRNNTKTLALPLNKKTHKFIIGSKGSGIAEIFEKTGCYIELPNQSDPSDLVVIRGAESTISLALNLVLEKSSSITIETIPLPSIYKDADDMALFVKYFMIKERPSLRELESDQSVGVYLNDGSNPPVFEIQGKLRNNVLTVRDILQEKVKTIASTLTFDVMDIPHGLHKHVLGKGKANLAKLKNKPEFQDRLQDIVLPSESEERDEVILVLKRSTTDDKKAEKSFNKLVKEELMKTVTQFADFTTLSIHVDPKYHGRLIGASGSHLKSLMEPYEGKLSVKFSKKGEGNSEEEVVIKGPQKEAAQFKSAVESLVAEWRHLEIMNSYSETIELENDIVSRVIPANSSILSMQWLLNGIREEAKKTSSKVTEKDLASPALNLRIHSEQNEKGDVIIVIGPKPVVEIAIPLLKERVELIKKSVVEECNLFDLVPSSVASGEHKNNAILRLSIMARLIGKGGKTINKLTERYNITMNIQKQNDAVKEDGEPVQVGHVTLKGLKKDVESAKKELSEWIQHELQNSFTDQVKISKGALPNILSKRGGNGSQSIREIYGVRLDIQDLDEDESSVLIALEGAKESVTAAKAKILDMADHVVNNVTEKTSIPNHLHRHIIGPSGQRIQSIIDKFGGIEKAKIQFPRGEGQNQIEITAHKSKIGEIKEALFAAVQESLGLQGNTATVTEFAEMTFEVHQDDVPKVIGKGGERIKELTKKHGVSINLGDRKKAQVKISLVAVKGQEVALKKVKDEILSTATKHEEIGLSSFIPKANAHALSLIELALKKLRFDEQVRLYFEGESVTVRGSQKAIEEAIPLIRQKLEGLDLSHSQVIETKSSLRAHLIGKGGATISKIRETTGAIIEIESKNDNQLTIILSGNETEVEAARNAIQSIIEKQEVIQKKEVERAAAAKRAEETAKASVAATLSVRIDEVLEQDHHKRPSGIPGWSSKKGTVAIPSVDILRQTGSVLAEYGQSFENSQEKTEKWQAVKSRRVGGKKADEEQDESATHESLKVASAVVVGANDASAEAKKKKKKNNKKKSSNVPTNLPSTQNPFSVIEKVAQQEEEWTVVGGSNKGKKN